MPPIEPVPHSLFQGPGFKKLPKMSDADDALIASSDYAGGSFSPLRSSTLSDSGINDGLMPLLPKSHFLSLKVLKEHALVHFKAYKYATANI